MDADISTSIPTSTTPPLPPRLFYHPPSVLAVFFHLHPHPLTPPFLLVLLLVSLRCSRRAFDFLRRFGRSIYCSKELSLSHRFVQWSGAPFLGKPSLTAQRMGAPLISRAVAPRIFTNGMPRCLRSFLPFSLSFCFPLPLYLSRRVQLQSSGAGRRILWN